MNFPFWYFSLEDVSVFLMKPTTDHIIFAQPNVWFSINLLSLRRAESGRENDLCYWNCDMCSSSLACSSDCTLCEEVGRCKACREQTYLMEGYCTPSCGHGYYADQKTRTCQGDNICLS